MDEQNSRSTPGLNLTRGGRCSAGEKSRRRSGREAGEWDVDEAQRQWLVCWVTRAGCQRKPAVRVGSLITLWGAWGDMQAERGRSTTLGVGRREGEDSEDPAHTGEV